MNANTCRMFIWLTLTTTVLLLAHFTLAHMFLNEDMQQNSTEPQLKTVSHKTEGNPPSNGIQTQHEFTKGDEKSRVLASLTQMLTTPIDFHGRVVDQDGEPVPNAEVGYGLLDKLLASGSGGKTTSDEFGNIRITGVKGAVIGVNVEKAGYYSIHDVSNQSFSYGYAVDEYNKSPPTRENPAVFVLHKMGETAALLHLEEKSFLIPRDGTPVRVDLTRRSESESGELVVQAWTGTREPGGPRRYDWRCRVSIPGGGLVERVGEFNFTAPESGYREVDEVHMAKDAERWLSRFEKEYFVRTVGNQYARLRLWFTTGGQHFFIVETYLNPEPGDRNLEYEEAKRVRQE